MMRTPGAQTAPARGAGRVATRWVWPVRVTRATCLPRAKMRSAEPSGSSAMFSGCWPPARLKWATTRAALTGGLAARAAVGSSSPLTTATAAMSGKPRRRRRVPDMAPSLPSRGLAVAGLSDSYRGRTLPRDRAPARSAARHEPGGRTAAAGGAARRPGPTACSASPARQSHPAAELRPAARLHSRTSGTPPPPPSAASELTPKVPPGCARTGEPRLASPSQTRQRQRLVKAPPFCDVPTAALDAPQHTSPAVPQPVSSTTSRILRSTPEL